MDVKETQAFARVVGYVKCSCLIALVLYSSAAWPQWKSVGNEARVAMYLPQAVRPNTYAVLTIGYQKKFFGGCEPEVSVVIMIGRTLGSFVKRGVAKQDKLVMSIDGRNFTGKTTINIYQNGVEKVMDASSDLIDAMERYPKRIVALTDPNRAFDFSGQPGFKVANRAALRNCSQ